MAIIGNLQHVKETIAIAKTPGHRKKRKVIESLPLDWWIISITNQVQIEVLRIRWKELSDDQHSCAGSAGTQPVSHDGSGAQIHKNLGVAEKV